MQEPTFLLRLGLCVLLAGAAMPAPAAEDPYAQPRERMVADVRAMASAVGGKSEISEAVLAALGRVPRHLFVPDELRGGAYANRPLPIGQGQTISQPYIVALMTELVRAGPGSKILEVGTGSGYQAAVLGELGAEIYTVEIVPELGRNAASLLTRLGYGAVRTRIGDGYLGWPEAAPFDGILVTAAPDHVPPPLTQQLKPGGRMVIPVGPGGAQNLMLMIKRADGTIETQEIIPVAFVPLTGKR
jgi:protein-L-isoaspartate(D-aspartate) O-methyltransferase